MIQVEEKKRREQEQKEREAVHCGSCRSLVSFHQLYFRWREQKNDWRRRSKRKMSIFGGYRVMALLKLPFPIDWCITVTTMYILPCDTVVVVGVSFPSTNYISGGESRRTTDEEDRSGKWASEAAGGRGGEKEAREGGRSKCIQLDVDKHTINVTACFHCRC